MRLRTRSAVGTVAFAATVVLLLVFASGGFLLYTTKPTVTATQTTTEIMTETSSRTVTSVGAGATSTEVMTHTTTMTEVMNKTSTELMAEPAIPFAPAKGQMIHDAYAIIAPLVNGTYALTIHAQGLEAMSMGAYLVEGTQHGTNVTVPIGGQNVTLSEFEADSHGNGQFFITLNQNPAHVYDTISLVFLPGMEMTNATIAATAHVGM